MGGTDEVHVADSLAPRVELRVLGPQDAAELQTMFERAGDYFLRVTGRAAPAEDAAERELGSVAATEGREVALVVRVDGPGRGPDDPIPDDSTAVPAAPTSPPASAPVGAIGWWSAHPEPDVALVGMMMIAREERGRGLARAALRQLEDRLRSSAIERLRTAVGADDRESHRFLEAVGFTSMDQRARVDVDSGRLRIAFFEKAL